MKQYERMNAHENLGWCSPYRITAINGDEIVIANNENSLAGCCINGVDNDDITIAELARRCNPEYDEYEENDMHILLDTAGVQELGCAECPWRDICEAMEVDE